MLILSGSDFDHILILGSALKPASNFFVVFGVLMLLQVIFKKTSWEDLIQNTCITTLMAIASEIEHYIISQVFDLTDLIDIIAILLAAIIFLMMHRNRA